MEFQMNVSMDNAAFEELPATELSRILLDVAKKVRRGDFYGPCIDYNGNKCGEWQVSGEDAQS